MTKKATREEYLTQLYNEILNSAVRTEVDLEYAMYSMLKEPHNDQYAKDKAELTHKLEVLNKVLEITKKKLEEK